MKNTILTVLICLLSLTSINADETIAEAHYKVYLAEKLIAEKEFAKADNILKNVLENNDLYFWEIYKLTFDNLFTNLNADRSQYKDRFNLYISRMAKVDVGKEFVINYVMGAADKATKRFAKKAYAHYAKQGTDIDKELQEAIKRMFEIDQEVRVAPESGERDKEMIRVDSANWVEIQAIIKRYNRMPGVKDFGLECYHDFTILLAHHCYRLVEEPYKTLLLNAVNEGSLLPKHVAYPLDYARMAYCQMEDDKLCIPYSIYGVLNFNSYVIPVKDEKIADKRRKEIGLPPLRYYAQKRGYIYDVEKFKENWNLIDL